MRACKRAICVAAHALTCPRGTRARRMWEAMVRLVGQHHPEGVAEAHLLAAQALQLERQWREAERHFAAAPAGTAPGARSRRGLGGRGRGGGRGLWYGLAVLHTHARVHAHERA